MLTTAAAPQANAAGGLADWLTKASVQVTEIHKAEGDAITAIQVDGPIDFTAIEVACRKLESANTAFSKTLPTPDPKLTAEIQQAVDNFESATQSCGAATQAHLLDKLKEFLTYLRKAERHLASADAIVVKLPPS